MYSYSDANHALWNYAAALLADAGSAPTPWAKWRRVFEVYVELAADANPDFRKRILLTALGVEGLHAYFELQEAQTQAGKTKHSSIGESTDVYQEALKMLERQFVTTFNKSSARKEEHSGQNIWSDLQPCRRIQSDTTAQQNVMAVDGTSGLPVCKPVGANKAPARRDHPPPATAEGPGITSQIHRPAQLKMQSVSAVEDGDT